MQPAAQGRRLLPLAQLQAAAASLNNPLRPDPSINPDTRLHKELPRLAVLLCLLAAGSRATIDSRAESQPGGLLRLKRSMTCPSASAITCVTMWYALDVGWGDPCRHRPRHAV